MTFQKSLSELVDDKTSLKSKEFFPLSLLFVYRELKTVNFIAIYGCYYDCIAKNKGANNPIMRKSTGKRKSGGRKYETNFVGFDLHSISNLDRLW